MIIYDKALELIEKTASDEPLSSEWVPLSEAAGRWLAGPVISPEAVPAFNNSAMDGFALRSAITGTACAAEPRSLRVTGILPAGGKGAASGVGPSDAIEIMTGAPLPDAFDAVVRLEDVRVERDDLGTACLIELRRPVLPGENVRLLGTDFDRGARVMGESAKLGPEH
ncbi:MAG: hypothetical protein IT285_13250, partial [Bdellovibrionales bacterium]|nr:hypothetical protein [Bdellovibrionales bacterium]